jgi:gliding motility-associated-like protein
MKSIYTQPGSKYKLPTFFTKHLVLLFLITALAVTKTNAQCGDSASVQRSAPPTMTGVSDATWAGIQKNAIGASPSNVVTNNSGNVFPVASSGGTHLGTATSKPADFGAPTWQAQWTTTALYLLVTVPDLTVHFDPIPNDPFFYNYDAIEVYLSGTNNHAPGLYGPNDVQYGFSNGVYRGIGGGTGAGSSTAGVTQAVTVTPGVGYTMAITIPLTSFSSPSVMNSIISFDIAIDDNDHVADIATAMAADSATLTHAPYNYPPTGATSAQSISQGYRSGGDYRDAQVAWHATTGGAPYNTPSQLSYLKLTAPPTVATAHNQSICGSGIITLAGNAPTVGTGTWSATGGMANLSQLPVPGDVHNPIATFFSAGLGSYVFTWSIVNSTCSLTPSTALDSIIVSPVPVLIVTNPAPVCAPNTVDLTDPTVIAGSTIGTAITYSSDPAGITALPTPTAITTSGTYYIKSTTTSNCITITPVVVTINPQPILSITDPAQVCFPATVNITVPAVTAGSTGGGVLSYYTDPGATSPLSTPSAVPASGTYYIKSTGAGCTDLKPVTVVVNPLPILVITAPGAVCQPSTVDITAGSVIAGSTLSPGTTIGYYSNPGATTAIGAPATIATGGTYYIKATTLSGCIDIEPVVVTINLKPVITISKTNPTACASATGTIIIGGLTPGGIYTINYDKGGVAQPALTLTANGAGTVTIPTLSSDSYTNIKVTSAAGCTSNPAAITLTDPAAPIPVASTGGMVCTGGSLSISTTAPGGATIVWSGPGGFTSGAGSFVRSPATSADSGVYNVSVTVAGCTGTSSVVGVVNPTPVLVITTPTAVCAPGGIDVTAGSVTTGSTLPPGTTLGYYTNAGGTTPLGTPGSVTTSGTYYIKASTATCSDIKPVVVTINPKPAITVSKTNPTACATATGTIIISGLTPGGVYTVNYNKGGVAQPQLTLTANGAGTVTIPTLGSDSYTNITVTSAAGCTSNPASITLNDPAAPTPVASTTGPVCIGGSLSISTTAPGGATIVWSGPGGFTSGAGSFVRSPATSADSGLYNVSVTVAGCTGTSSVVGVVNPTPVLVITTPTAACAPGGVDITVGSVTTGSTLPPGTTLGYYTNAGGTLPVGTPGSVTTSGTYYIKASTGTCSDIKPVVVIINPTPSITVSKTNPTACATATGTIIISGLTPGGIYKVNYDKGGVAQPQLTLTANGAGTVTIPTLGSDSYTNITATSAAGCISNTASITLNDPAAPTPVASTTGPVCIGGSLSISTIAPGGSTIVWSGPGGFTSGAGSFVRSPATSADSGVYNVSVTLAGCTGTSSVVGVVNPTPILIITTPAAACSPGGVDITAGSVTTGSTLPSGTTVGYYTNAAGTLPVGTPGSVTASGTYYIKASTATCSDIKPVVVTINPTPSITISKTDPTTCATATGSIKLSGLTAGATYTINFDKGGVPQTAQTLTADGTGTVTVPNLGAGTYTTVTATSASNCVSNTTTITLTDPAAPTPIASTGGPVCTGGSLSISTTAPGGATIVWSGPGGFTSGAGSFVRNPATSADSGVYNVTVTVAGCTGNASVVGVVNPTPALIISNPMAACAPGGVDITVGSVTAGSTLPTGTTLSYYTNAAGTATLGTPGNVTTSGTYYIKAATATCSDIKPVVVTINPTPAITVSKTDPSACASATGSIIISGLTAGATYTINFDKGGVPQTAQTLVADGTGTVTPVGLSAGSYTAITATSAANCISNAGTATLTDPAAPSPIASSLGAACSGTGTLSLSTTAPAGATFVWSGPNGFASTQQNPVITNASYADSGLYTVAVTVAGCTGNTSVVGVVHLTPVLVITNPTAVCTFIGIDITVPSVTAGSTFPASTTLSYYADAAGTVPLATPTSVPASGTYYIKASSPTCSVIEPVVIMMNGLPPISATSNNPLNCGTPDGAFVISGLSATAVYTINYEKDGVPQTSQTQTADAAGTVTITGLSAGSYTAIAVTSALGCTSNAASTTLTDPTAPTPVASTLGDVCSGNTLSLATTAPAGATFVWTGPNGFTSTQQNPVITNVAFADSGLYNVAVTITGCTGNSSVVGVVNQTPVLTITNPSAICAPAGIDITTAAVTTGSFLPSGTTLSYYTDATATTTVTTPANITTSGTYYIKAATATCSDIKPVVVTINPLPILTITNPAGVCTPATVDITTAAVTAGSTGGTTLGYYSDATATTILPTAGTIATSGTYYIKYSSATCSVTEPVNVTVNPTPILTVTDPRAVCSPGTVDITTAAVTAGSTGGTTYTYYTDATATTLLAAPTTVATSGTYYIKYSSATCSIVEPVTVTINPLPVLTVTDPAGVCSPGTIDITTAAVTAGSTGGTFSYYSDAAATSILPSPGSISASGTYYIKSTTGVGCSVTSPVTVTINPLPVLTITDPADVCSPATVDITTAAITTGSTTGTTFTYYTDAAATNTLTTAAAVATSGAYYIKSTTTPGCSVVAPVRVIINPLPVLVTTNPASVCSPATINITAPAVTAGSTTGTTLNYYTDIAATNPLATPTAIPTSGTYYIQSTNSFSCSVVAPVTVTVNITPDAPSPNNASLCQYDKNVAPITANLNTSTNTLVWYFVAAGGDSSFTAPVPPTQKGGVTLQYYVAEKSATCLSSRVELDVRITTTPKVSVTASANEIYANNTVTLSGSVTPASANVDYTWIAGEITDAPFATSDLSQTVTPPSSIEPPFLVTNYFFIATSTENPQCADTASVAIRVIQPILVPNIFSPNGDGINEYWDIKNIQEFPNAEVSIFNRYGQFIYKSSDGYRTPWDGTYNGDPVPVGTYFYIIKTTSNAAPLSGPVSVVR